MCARVPLKNNTLEKSLDAQLLRLLVLACLLIMKEDEPTTPVFHEVEPAPFVPKG